LLAAVRLAVGAMGAMRQVRVVLMMRVLMRAMMMRVLMTRLLMMRLLVMRVMTSDAGGSGDAGCLRVVRVMGDGGDSAGAGYEGDGGASGWCW